MGGWQDGAQLLPSLLPFKNPKILIIGCLSTSVFVRWCACVCVFVCLSVCVCVRDSLWLLCPSCGFSPLCVSAEPATATLLPARTFPAVSAGSTRDLGQTTFSSSVPLGWVSQPTLGQPQKSQVRPPGPRPSDQDLYPRVPLGYDL